jgi:hypothetical protein
VSISFPEIVSMPRQRRLGRAGRLGLLGAVLVLAAALLAVADYRLLPPDRPLDGPRARERLERGLGIHLSSVPPVATAAGMANVDATYSGQLAGHRLLVVVFDSDHAPVQIAGRARDSFGVNGRAFRWKNVVVLYDHEFGTPSLSPIVAAVLAGPRTASRAIPSRRRLLPLVELGRGAPRHRTAASR